MLAGAAQELDKYGNVATANFLLLRLNTMGVLDDTFAPDAGGYRLANFDLTGIGAPGFDAATSIVIEPSGNIVAGGGAYFDQGDKHFAFIRVDDMGQMDPAFGNGGMLHFGASSPINDLSDFAVDPSGNLILGGSIYYGAKQYAAVAKLTPAGQIDPNFNNGYVSIFSYGVPPAPAQYDFLTALGLDSSGGIVTVGGFDTADIQGAAAQRLTPAGKLDPAFGSGAPVAIASDPNAYPFASAIHVLPSGGFVAAGFSYGTPGSYLYFAKFLADGTPDASFGANGIAKLLFNTQSQPVFLAPTKRGGWLMAGPNSQQGVFLAKVLGNGDPDTTLNGTGFIALDFPPDAYSAFGLFYMGKPALTQDGRLVVAGSLPEAEANGSGDIGVIRILADYDTVFVSGFE